MRCRQSRLEQALELHPTGIVTVAGVDLRIVSLNQAARQLADDIEGFDIGFSLIELERRGYTWQRETGETMTACDLAFARAMRERRPVRDEFVKLSYPNGRFRWFLTNASPLPDAEGEEAAALGFLADSTERKMHDEERRRLDVRLTQAQKLESMSVMAGGIAHDFNNLLMTMMGHADIALSEMSPMAPSRENVVQILNAARRAADLTRQMLIYTGKGRTTIELLNLQEMIEEMTHLLEVSVSKKSHLRFQFAPDLPLIDGEPTQIRQVLMNLVINASEA
ncbi:MAG TPA: PAS domain-containing protein, partial [Candidatus Ozemobacteraceae bacterium]|nr:PAS domain-containing protein [Candidatus Ozemobacteraceae bacterium]